MNRYLVAMVAAFAALTLSCSDARAQEDLPENAVTFFAIVAPGATQAVLNATIGQTQVSAEELADSIRADSGRVLRITSVHGSLFGAPSPPALGDYAMAFVGACGPRLSVRGFGNGYIAFGGLDTVRVAYRPGLVASLNRNELLCFRSLTQSNQAVVMEVHGYLMKD